MFGVATVIATMFSSLRELL